MRMNIYEEELGEGVEVVRTVSKQGEEFVGLRVWLKSPQEILDHSTEEDDDRCAVTFWAKDAESLERLWDQMRVALGL